MIDSPQLARVFDRVLELGGHWETIFRGIGLIYLPRSTTYDPLADLKRRHRREAAS
jgi:hypothetical protein